MNSSVYLKGKEVFYKYNDVKLGEIIYDGSMVLFFPEQCGGGAYTYSVLLSIGVLMKDMTETAEDKFL